MGRKGRYQRWAVVAVLVLLTLCVTGAVYPMVFYMNDDVTMRNILSGVYTGMPDGHAVYMKYPLTGLLSLLYRLTDRVPWFSLLLAGNFWLAVSMALGHLAEMVKGLKAAGIGIMAGVALLCAALFLPHFIYLHYTVAAAVLGGCGLFLCVTGAGWAAALPLVLCYCVRSQVFFLLLPFLGIAVLWQLCQRKVKEQAALLTLMAGCILICMLWDGLMYRSEDWERYKAYNESRTQLYDYNDLLPYEQNAVQYEEAGIGPQEYTVLEQYALALDNAVDADMLQAAADIYADRLAAGRSAWTYLKECVLEYYYHAAYTDQPYNYIAIAAYLLTVALLLWRRRWMQLLLVCCLAAGRSVIWVYLLWQGRFPERIYVSLYLTELMMLAGMSCATAMGCLRDSMTGERGFPIRRVRTGAAVAVASLFCAALFAAGIYQMESMEGRVAKQLAYQERWNALTAYCEERDTYFYLLDVRSMVSYAGEVWESVSGEANYLLDGGWMSATPLLQARIQKLGAEDGAELLSNSAGEVFYITAVNREAGWLDEYLERRFGGTSLEQVDSILLSGEEVFRVYRCVEK